MSRLLDVEGLSVRHGQVQAVREARLHVDDGELVVVVGPNGAGKSSLMRAIAGLGTASGRIELSGRRIDRWTAERRVRAGSVLVPEGRHLFGQMTVQENLQLATWGLGRVGPRRVDEAMEMFPVLRDRSDQAATTLSGGEQQMLALSRAIIKAPKLLILDEPSMGLAPMVVKQMFDLIAQIHAGGTSVLLVEQNARAALGIADRAYSMASGELRGGGAASDLLDEDALRAAYFGQDDA